jgi:uncharacterized integral membrane protein
MADRTRPNPPARQASASRTAMIWIFTIAALLLLVLLIIFILQNQDAVRVRYFGLEGSLPLGVALLIAAVAGGLLVAVSGVARVTALRIKAHRETKERDARPAPPAVVNEAADVRDTEPRRLDTGTPEARADRAPGEQEPQHRPRSE